MTRTRIRRTVRGVDAVEAAVDELELRERLDETDPGDAAPADVDLSSVARRLADDLAQRASTPDEAMEELAAATGREPLLVADDYDY